jgi:hypothetical protein
MVSSISDSQPHYSVGLLYHRAGLAVQSFLLLYVEKYHIILLRLIALHSVCGCSHGCAFRFQHFHHLVFPVAGFQRFPAFVLAVTFSGVAV